MGYDSIVMRGEPANRSFSIVYLKKGRIIALDCVNATKEYVQGKALVVVRLSPKAGALSDINTPLAAIAKQAELAAPA